MTLESQQTDDDHSTWSRTELLRMRDYSPDVIAGVNGHAPAAGPNPDTRIAITPPETVSERRCRGCQTALDGAPSRIWCSERCRRAHRAPTPAATASVGAAEPAAVIELTEPNGFGPASEGQLAPSLPAGTDRLSPLYNALMAAGVSVVRIEVAVAGETWLITRSNGAHL